ncbi:MAG: 16S rRNA (cytosine(1402)-N(4))-methyltransferase RsmH [Armatimonadia bacterium]|nr:16S rRNA (cytosine(1402)-N(4))-methyltransferase RsmH [Armatimonadia bacterium]
MLQECLDLLAPQPGEVMLDATLGGGGHARALCEVVGESGRVIGLDKDPDAIDVAARGLAPHYPQLHVVHADFGEMAEVVAELSPGGVDGVLMDLGVSSMQIDPGSGRGFSFQGDEPLDMRMDPTRGESAAELLGRVDARELADILWRYGDERHSRRVARAVLDAHAEEPLRTTAQLADVVRDVVPPSRDGLDPATRTFMALRIRVNRELDALAEGLDAAVEVLRHGGRLVVLAYHSGEDRIVKHLIAGEVRGCTCPPEIPVCMCGRTPTLTPLTKKPLRPSEAETRSNPRARSCRLRAAQRIRQEDGHGDP